MKMQEARRLIRLCPLRKTRNCKQCYRLMFCKYVEVAANVQK